MRTDFYSLEVLRDRPVFGRARETFAKSDKLVSSSRSSVLSPARPSAGNNSTPTDGLDRNFIFEVIGKCVDNFLFWLQSHQK